mmetsp:Transcript_52653/g.87230  ORF Transcript_52653/g.87230 Transcript_52653/m.87230 type:complete len:407 (+) Transcript_52653:294-1514(+)
MRRFILVRAATTTNHQSHVAQFRALTQVAIQVMQEILLDFEQRLCFRFRFRFRFRIAAIVIILIAVAETVHCQLQIGERMPAMRAQVVESLHDIVGSNKHVQIAQRRWSINRVPMNLSHTAGIHQTLKTHFVAELVDDFRRIHSQFVLIRVQNLAQHRIHHHFRRMRAVRCRECHSANQRERRISAVQIRAHRFGRASKYTTHQIVALSATATATASTSAACIRRILTIVVFVFMRQFIRLISVECAHIANKTKTKRFEWNFPCERLFCILMNLAQNRFRAVHSNRQFEFQRLDAVAILDQQLANRVLFFGGDTLQPKLRQTRHLHSLQQILQQERDIGVLLRRLESAWTRDAQRLQVRHAHILGQHFARHQIVLMQCWQRQIQLAQLDEFRQQNLQNVPFRFVNH